MRLPSKKIWAAAATAMVAAGAMVMLEGALSGCRRPPPVATSGPRLPAKQRSADCRSCHEEIFKSWAESDHAHALRAADAKLDADAFVPERSFVLHTVKYSVGWRNGSADFVETRPGAQPEHYTADLVLGYRPLRQYLAMMGDGRYQVTELAFDPARKEWFNVFGNEQRQPTEWGSWRGRGMNWNSMCAHCHTTDFHKNYTAASDSYASTWREPGVGCVQCHGDLPPEHGTPGYKPNTAAVAAKSARPGEPLPRAVTAARQQAMETCAPCHARNELLTGDVRPNVPYADHYRLTLPIDAAVFFPDGQMRDEDFNWTSFVTSRMGGKAGVTCFDCHDPHSGKTRLPAENNLLCLQCHGPNPQRNAPTIDPTAHSHHGAESTGNRCVECHMPTTTFMQRDPRHDHGYLKPDPLLTKELGIPNACNRCHADKTLDWQIEAMDRWYGKKMESRQRERARAVAAVQRATGATAPGPTGTDTSIGTPTEIAGKLLALFKSEDVPAWRATLLVVTRPFASSDKRVVDAAREALADPDPLVRSAAVQVLNASPERGSVGPMLKDPSRLVRLDAEWSLSEQLANNSTERREFNAYLAANADQPAGQLRIAQDLFNRGRVAEAEAPLRKAVVWDPNFEEAYATLGTVLNSLDRNAESAAAFWRASQLNKADPNLTFNAALAFAAAQKLPDAELALRETIRRAPGNDRAWYNLGLLLAQSSREAEGIEALREAEKLAPTVADYPYARATIHWKRGERDAAVAAAKRALEIDPQNQGARSLLDAAK